MRARLAVLLMFVAALAARGEAARHIVRNASGEVTDVFGGIVNPGDPRIVIESIAGRLNRDPRLTYELADERQSLSATHYRYRQLLDGVEIHGAELRLSRQPDGSLVSFHDRRATTFPSTRPPRIQAASETAGRTLLVNLDGVATWLKEELEGTAPFQWRVLRDLSTGAVIRREPLFFNKEAKVFRANPVTKLNDTSLQDRNDTAAAVPPGAYEVVELPSLAASGKLAGAFVEIADFDAPSTVAADIAGPLLFDRSQKEFEEVNAYFHIDHSQRYIRSLGFSGMRAIVDRPIRVDVHALSGVDNSFYSFAIAGRGDLYFGDGGVDDAEDSDILLHEYAHAIQDSISPGSFGGAANSQSRAIGEGFGDYWAFSSGYLDSIRGGRDPFCIGDWDARCGSAESSSCSYPAGADCLRRVDGMKTMNDYSSSSSRGVEHRNGEIWSSALREVFVNLVQQYGLEEGKRRTDTIVLEAHFGVPSSPTFGILVQKMLAADRALYAGAHTATICGAMSSRRIASECTRTPHGEAIVFPSLTTQQVIPDVSSISSIQQIDVSGTIVRAQVSVAIRHARRGELSISLRTPWQEEVSLLQQSSDSEADIRGTFGSSLVSSGSLGVLSGRSGRGEWELIVTDHVSGNVGVLEGWSLELQLEGVAALESRPTGGASIVVPVVGQTAGANGTNFISDVRIFNSAATPAAITLVFTPSGSDGRTDFAAQRLHVPAGATLALNRIVQSLFRSEGVGSLEIRDDVHHLQVTSRTYNTGGAGTFGQFIPPVDQGNEVTSTGQRALVVAPLTHGASFRANVGIVETSGSSGELELLLRDEAGSELRRERLAVLPFGHHQRPLGEVTCEGCRLEVTVVSGLAVVAAYGSVIDNRSGDAVFLPASSRSSAPGRAMHLAAAIEAPGANGTKWRSDLYVENASPDQQTVDIRLIQRGSSLISRQVTLGSGAALLSRGYLASLFGATGTGRVEIAGDADVHVSSRIWNDAESGSFGQFVPAFFDDDLLRRGDVVTLLQVEESESFRTNLGFAEVAGEAAIVIVRLLDGTGAEQFITTIGIPAGEVVQASLRQLGAPHFSDGRVTAEMIGGGRIAAYASVIDNGTGDPIFIPARRGPLN